MKNICLVASVIYAALLPESELRGFSWEGRQFCFSVWVFTDKRWLSFH